MIQSIIIQEIQNLETWEEKYTYLVELGQELPKLSDTQKTNQNRVSGCQSRVWLDIKMDNNLLNISAESDSLLVGGLLAIVISIYSKNSKQEILEIGSSWVSELELNSHLSMVRQNGLNAVLEKIFDTAKN